jgi:hypothetical protein
VQELLKDRPNTDEWIYHLYVDTTLKSCDIATIKKRRGIAKQNIYE